MPSSHRWFISSFYHDEWNSPNFFSTILYIGLKQRHRVSCCVYPVRDFSLIAQRSPSLPPPLSLIHIHIHTHIPIGESCDAIYRSVFRIHDTSGTFAGNLWATCRVRSWIYTLLGIPSAVFLRSVATSHNEDDISLFLSLSFFLPLSYS